MSTVAKITQQGELKISGNIDTRSPLVTEGLVSHYPMDGSTKGIANFNKLDYSTWTVGSTGSQSGFSQNGDGNSIIKDYDPFGGLVPVWRTLGNDAESNADGGWNSNRFSVDETKTYRFSTWIKREILGNGTYYFGCYAYPDTVLDRTTGTSTGNPYFRSTSGNEILGEWFLLIGHVFASGSGIGSNHNESGVYNHKGNKVANISNDFVWSSGTTEAKHRTYLYYSTLPEASQKWVYPRVDAIDGTEPKLEDLLKGEGNVINPSTDTATTITNDYVGIEEPTTNVVANSNDWNSGWSLNYNTGIRYDDVRAPEGAPNSHVISFYDNSPDKAGYVYSYGDYAPQTPGEIYTVSLYVKTKDSNFRIKFYTANNSEIGRHHSEYITVPNDGEWHRIVWNSFTNSSDSESDSLSFRFLYGNEKGEQQRTWLCAPQMEAKQFATEYVDGSRTSAGSITIPTEIGTDDFTITGSFTPNSNSDPLPNNSYFLNLGGGFLLRTYNNVPYIDGNSIAGAGSNNIHIDYNTLPYDEVNYVIKREGTEFTWRMVDSRQDTVWAKVHSNVPLINVSSIHLNYSWGGSHKNLSVYNRALTDAEIQKNIKGTHSITHRGLISRYPIVSEALRPASSNYFPLEIDGKDYYKSTVPVLEDFVEFVDGSAWIGNGTTNLYYQGNFTGGLHPVRNGPWSIQSGGPTGQNVTKLVGDGTTSYQGRDIVAVVGTNYTASCLIYISNDSNTTSMRIRGEQGFPFSALADVNKKGQWQKVSVTGAATTENARVLLYELSSMTTGYILATDVQFELGNYPTPFVDGSRGESSLHLPYDIIDCKEDFTIYGWWKPLIYADGAYRPCLTRNIPDSNDTGNRILIMGHGTTSLRLRCWTSSGGSSEVSLYGSTDVKVGEWNFFCLRRSGTSANLYVGNSTGYSKGSGVDVGTSLLNDEVGQVWQVGEYANSESDAYHRDYVFEQSAMTDTEIESKFKTKMKATLQGLHLQNGVSSGIIL